MAMFQPFQGGLSDAFNVAGNFERLGQQQQLTQAAMLDVAAKFDETNKQMANLRAGVEGILSNYKLDENGKPDASAPKYVHDAFNAVKKEGGVMGMSATQLGAVLNGYQTGVAAEQQRYNSMVVQRNIRQMQEEDKLNEAYRKTQEEREKVAKEEERVTRTPKTTSKSYDLNKPEETTSFVLDLIAEGQKREQEGGRGVLRRPKKTGSWFDKSPAELIAEASLAAQNAEAEKRKKEVDDAKKLAEVRESEYEIRMLKRERQGLLSANEASKARPVITNIVVPIPTAGAGMQGGSTSSVAFAQGSETYNLSPSQIQELEDSQNRANLQNVARISQVDERIAELEAKKEQTLPGYLLKPKAAAATVVKPEKKAEIETTQYIEQREKVQRTQEAMLNDEYAVMTNYLRNNGGLPSNWSKGAFMQLKGYPSIQTIPIEGVGTYVSINGKGEIIKDTPMSIGDRANIRDAAILAQQRTLNGVDLGGNSGYVFTGEIGSNSIKDVNTVREELGKSTIALKNVDTLIKIAEDASLLDKLLPGEITGMAGGISNAIAAANRTEIGGSGAWSEADEARLQLIVRDPTKLRNMAFRQETLASLQAYKQRLTDGIKMKGQTYGFKLSGTPQDKRRAEAAIQRARIAYQTAMMQGKTKEEASEIAKSTYSQSLE